MSHENDPSTFSPDYQRDVVTSHTSHRPAELNMPGSFSKKVNPAFDIVFEFRMGAKLEKYQKVPWMIYFDVKVFSLILKYMI